MKTKITHFGKYYFPDRGGVESVTYSLASAAAKDGFEVKVICFHHGNAFSSQNIFGVNVLRSPVLINISSQPLGLKYFIQCLWSGFKSDLIHLHAPNLLASLSVIFIPKNVKILVHWHSDVINKGFLSWLIKPIEFLMLLRADSIVATSPNYAVASNMLSCFSKKVAIVPIGVTDVVDMPCKCDDIKIIDDFIDGKNLILSVGRLVSYKGFLSLIEAAKYLSSNSRIVIVGSGVQQKILQEKILELGVSDRVMLAGHVNSSSLNYLFKSAKLFCLPSNSRAEAFGVVLLEAMAHGLPIVATNIIGSGVPWVSQDGLTGINVPADDPIALAEACQKIIDSDELQAIFSVASRDRFVKNFRDVDMNEQFMSIYKKLISN